jgi:ABC-type Na+ efflux pump permease subunit
MKAWNVAIKDLTQSFRSMFAVVFMFGIPILVTGMFYFMLGSAGEDDEGTTIPPTLVQIVDLDEGSPNFTSEMSHQVSADMPQSVGLAGVKSMGEVLIAILQSSDFTDLITLTVSPDEMSARAAVDAQQAGVAVIIPVDFTAALMDQETKAIVFLYQDPALTIGPAIVRALLAQMIEQFAGAKISLGVVFEQLNQAGVAVDEAQAQSIAIQYLQTTMGEETTRLRLDVRDPAGEAANDQAFNPIAMVMGAMMIFFGFFTGAATAESILREDERGTLSRLFTTPTRTGTILAGKLIAVALTLIGQVTFLMLFGWLVFRIYWGEILPAFLAGLGLVILAGTFGVFLVSLLKNTRQGSVVFGGVMTITGMLGVINMFTMGAPNANPMADRISLLVPQGWAMSSLSLAMEGASIGELLPWFGGALLWSAVFFTIGNLRLKRRFA